MTYEEAIKKITNFLVGAYQRLIDGDIVNDEKDAYRNLIKVCETAKQAIEKQIPQKPIDQIDLLTTEVTGRCPLCNTRQSLGDLWWHKNFNKYCIECGQAIDWSE